MTDVIGITVETATSRDNDKQVLGLLIADAAGTRGDDAVHRRENHDGAGNVGTRQARGSAAH